MTKTKAKLPRSFQTAGLSTETPETKHRMIWSLQGPEVTGKSWLACQQPPPIGYLAFDPGIEGSVDKFMRENPDVMIGLKEYAVPEPGLKGSQAAAKEQWNEFFQDYEALIADPDVPSIVIDTATEAWELARLAAFGRLERIPPGMYTEVNNDFRRILRLAKQSDKSVALIHKIKKEWVSTKLDDGKTKSEWFGNWERSGFSDLGYNVQVQIETFKTHSIDKKGKSITEFGFMVLDCKQNANIERWTFTADDCNFVTLATKVFPETDVEDWV